MSLTWQRDVWSVSEANRLIGRHLESDQRFTHCAVAGELSNFKLAQSGHMYFTLKDESSRLKALMFSGRNRSLRFRPADGMRVVCTGSISVFDRDGVYQLYVDDMEPQGLGALYAAFEQLKARLSAEGLFEANVKQPLPDFPRHIGVVTSPTGAVWRDICTTLARRWPIAKVTLAPAAVQGEAAKTSIVAALKRLSDWSESTDPVDVVIVGRGGGSLEELWPFNEEVVARAVFALKIPVISAVGHETDTTICDLVADVRAATPTAAAELASPDQGDLRRALTDYRNRSRQAVLWQMKQRTEALRRLQNTPQLREPQRLIERRSQWVDYVEARLLESGRRPLLALTSQVHRLMGRLHVADPRLRMEQARTALAGRTDRAQRAVRQRIAKEEQRFANQVGKLEALSPLAVLTRGYSVVTTADGTVVSRRLHVHSGEQVNIRLSDGVVRAKIESVEGDNGDGGEQLTLDL